jgi:hypothetical protein
MTSIVDKAVVGLVLAIAALSGTAALGGTLASPAALKPPVTGSVAGDLGTRSMRPMGIGSDRIAIAGAVDPSSPPSEQQTPESDSNPQSDSNPRGNSDPLGETSRQGGSDPAPAPGKPGWVWWVTGAFVVMLGAGAFRLWRSGSFVTVGTDTGADVVRDTATDEVRETDDADEADGVDNR